MFLSILPVGRGAEERAALATALPEAQDFQGLAIYHAHQERWPEARSGEQEGEYSRQEDGQCDRDPWRAPLQLEHAGCQQPHYNRTQLH